VIPTDELNNLDEAIVLRQIDNDDRLYVTPIRRIAHHTKPSEKDRDDEHDTREHFRELLWFSHGFGKRDHPDVASAKSYKLEQALTTRSPQKRRQLSR